MHYVTSALAVLLLILVTIFAVQNFSAVDVALLFWSISVPKFVLILVVYVLGMLSGWGLVELVKAAF
jgi:putative membrane protein